MSYCTEKEASEKWCPFARVAVADLDGSNAAIPVFNRQAVSGTSDVKLPDASCCISSKCMMWQWFEASHQVKDQRRGICGLVLKPGPW